MRLTEIIRAELKASGESLGSISRKTGIHRTALSRFLAGMNGLHSAGIDVLAGYLFSIVVTRSGSDYTISKKPYQKPMSGRVYLKKLRQTNFLEEKV